MLTRKYVIMGSLGFIAIIAWNVFLVQRDEKMFKEYYGDMNLKEFCSKLDPSQFHRDCHVE